MVTIDVQAYTACWAVIAICTMNANINVNVYACFIYTQKYMEKILIYIYIIYMFLDIRV